MTTKTTCGEHRKTGFSYTWNSTSHTSALACRACGLPDTEHETLQETVTRLAAEWEQQHGGQS